MPVINVSYRSPRKPQFDPHALAVMGPQIRIDILPPSIAERYARKRGIKLPTASAITALIDTGASVTGVDEEVLNKQLKYPPIGVSKLSTPSGTTQTSVYMVRLIIPSRTEPTDIPRIVIDYVRVISVKLGNQPYKVLLGRDILSKMIMVYNGPQALVTLGY